MVNATVDLVQSFLAQDASTTLARIAAVGRLQRMSQTRAPSIAALHDWQLGLLDALGLREASDRFPSASISQLGDAPADSPSECWAHLTCVHFAAGMNDVAATVLEGEIALTQEDLYEIATTLSAHLRSDGYELGRRTGTVWRLRCPRGLRAETMPPEAAFRTSLKEALPSGANAAELRRLMTELQMLLHEHPVNVRRERAGLPAANAAWIWSVGNALPAVQNVRFPAAFGTEDYLKGLYSLHAQTVHTQDFDVRTIVDAARESGESVAVIAPRSFEALEREWVSPLVWLLKIGTFSRLVLYVASWRLELHRFDLVRFWRRSLPPSRWPA